MTPAHEMSLRLLQKAARKFRYYERNHRTKALGLPTGMGRHVDTLEKAEVNAELASEIERHLQLFPEANLED